MIAAPAAFTALPIVPTSSNGLAPGLPLDGQVGGTDFLTLMFQMLAACQAPNTPAAPAEKKDKNSIIDACPMMPGVSAGSITPINLTGTGQSKGTSNAASAGPAVASGVAPLQTAVAETPGASDASGPAANVSGQPAAPGVEPPKSALPDVNGAKEAPATQATPVALEAPTSKPIVSVAASAGPALGVHAASKDKTDDAESVDDDGNGGAAAVHPIDHTVADTHPRVEEARPSPPLHDQVHDQVAGQLDQLRSLGRVEVQMNLHPPELGQVKMHLALADGNLSVRFVVQNDGARSALAQHMEPMRVRFAEMGLSLGNFDVRRDSDSSNWQQAQDSDGAGQTEQVQGPAMRIVQKGYAPVTDANAMVDVIA